MSMKAKALEALANLPEDASVEDMMYRLYVLDKIEAGMRDIQNGDYISSDDLQKELDAWK